MNVASAKEILIMIPARNFPLGKKLVLQMIDRSFRKYFDRVYFRMSDEYTHEEYEKCMQPMIICANHSSWWDGYVIAIVQEQMGRDAYLMMEEAQLRRYFFFTWVGCFSVNRQNARSSIQSLKYAARLLKDQPNRIVSLFPQGEISPNDRRPLVFYNGAAYLARMIHPVQCCPLAIRIEYMTEQRPTLFISLGKPLIVSTEEAEQKDFLKHCTKRLEESVTAELDALRADVIERDFSSFRMVIEGKSSTNRLFDRLLFRKQIARHE